MSFYFSCCCVHSPVCVSVASHSVIDPVFGPESKSFSFLQLFISSYDLLWLRSVAISVSNKLMIERGQLRAGKDNITTL